MPIIHYKTKAYVADSPEFPIDRPFGYPHLLDTTDELEYAIEREELQCHVADGVITLLYHYSPKVLCTFLDLSIPEFTFVHNRPGKYSYDLLIQRQHDEVTVSTRNTEYVVVITYLQCLTVCVLHGFCWPSARVEVQTRLPHYRLGTLGANLW